MGCASPARWWTLEFVFHYAVRALRRWLRFCVFCSSF